MSYPSLGHKINCPVCKTPELISIQLEPELSSFNCPDCDGHWLRGREYWKWIESHRTKPAEIVHEEESLSLAEPGMPVDCPECRFRMVKYQVGRGLGFTVDHCHGCKGIWLDTNEWVALRKRNLHDDLHSIFTSFWQSGAQREVQKKRMEQIYLDRFGAEDYEEIHRVRLWLEPKTNRDELIAYLIDRDPFDA